MSTDPTDPRYAGSRPARNPPRAPRAAPILTQAEVENEIVRLSNAMDAALDELVHLSQDAANREVDHKVAEAKAKLAAGLQQGSGPGGRSTVDEREANALIKTEDAFRARLIAQALCDTCRERLRTMRSQIDALRTISANIRGMS